MQLSNKQAKYEAFIVGLNLLKSLDVQIMGDSQLVINQLLGSVIIQYWRDIAISQVVIDHGVMLTGDKIKAFMQEYEIRLIYSSPYYAQANSY